MLLIYIPKCKSLPTSSTFPFEAESRVLAFDKLFNEENDISPHEITDFLTVVCVRLNEDFVERKAK